MFKNKAFWVFFAALFLSFYSGYKCFAIEDVKSSTIYPDYAYEFVGKDKFEKFNRKLFIGNLKLNKYILRPLNIVWASIVPRYGIDRVQSAYNNINFPTRIVSCLLQKDFKASKQETARFFINTTIGFGGLYDPALNHFKIKPCNENMEQVLAHYKVKTGPFLMLPIVYGNISDLFGKLLDCPLNPVSYAGPFGAAANAILKVNNVTYAQPTLKKLDESYPDPYEIAKQVYGVDRYIKNYNLDRQNFLEEKKVYPTLIKVSQLSDADMVKPDVELTNFNSQSPLIDSLRTTLFDNQKLDSSIWADVSIWNRCFNKRIKTASVNVNSGRPNYKYRYILQKNKNAPLAILYPSIGDDIRSDKSLALTKILYDEGYSVAIQGSPFKWEFIQSMPEDYRPGMPSNDAKYLRATTAKILENLQIKMGYKPDKKIIVGCSFGALTGLFAMAQEEQEKELGKNTLEISNCIAINPPVELFFALKQVDKFAVDWKNDPSDLKLRTAVIAEKLIQVSQKIYHKDIKDMPTAFPFNDAESKVLIGIIMRQTLSDAVFTIEHCSRNKAGNIYEVTNSMSFNEYAKKYLSVNPEGDDEQTKNETSLYSIADFLKTSKKYKIYHALDDYFVNQKQISWLKQQSNNKAVFYSNGSHLGFLYRKEFIDAFKNDLKFQEIRDVKPQEVAPVGGL